MIEKKAEYCACIIFQIYKGTHVSIIQLNVL